MQPTPVFLPGKYHGQRSLAGWSLWGHKESDISKQQTDCELTVAQIMSSLLPNSDLQIEGKTTRPFMYDLNQIPYDYTMEVRNRFKGYMEQTLLSKEL